MAPTPKGQGAANDGRKQASLFSFFARKEKPSTPSAASVTSLSATPLTAKRSLSDATPTSTISPSQSSTRSQQQQQSGSASGNLLRSSSPPSPCSAYGKEVVGKRIQVWWPEDKEFYAGRITAYNASDRKHTLVYDDGEAENVDLNKETIKWEDGAGAAAAAAAASATKDDNEGDKMEQDDGGEGEGPASSSNNNRKRRLIRQEDSDSEEEFDFDGSKGEGAAGASSSSSAAAAATASKRKSVDFTPKSAFSSAASSMPSRKGEEEEEEGDSAGKRTKLDTKTTPFQRPSSSSSFSQSSSSKRTTSIPPRGPTSSSSTPAYKLFSPKTPSTTGSTKQRASTPSPTPSAAPEAESSSSSSERADGVLDYGRHTHHSLTWLRPNERLDANRRKPNDPDYSSRTIYVPPAFLAKETPAMKQWWEFKAHNFDTLLFFKVGKFYEIFHMDADIAVKECDVIYMKGEKGHSGFPESAYGKYSSQLVDKGYRIARIEQTETPEMMKEHNRNAGRGGKRSVVNRELCSVLSKGTRTFCYLDEAGGADETDPSGPLLMAIKEHIEVDEQAGPEDDPKITYGVCMLDPTTAKFQLGQFEDGPQRWRLRTMLTQFNPAEVLLERGVASTALEQIIRFCAPGAVVEMLRPEGEFWPSGKTLRMLKKSGYFPRGSKKEEAEEEDAMDEDGVPKGISRWPTVLKLIISAKDRASLALSALGASVWQLRRSLIDQDLLSMQNFSGYAPPDVVPSSTNTTAAATTSASDEGGGNEAMDIGDTFFGTTSSAIAASGEGDPSTTAATTTTNTTGGSGERLYPLVLDGTTLANLEIFKNSYDRSSKGSLWEYMNHTKTAFGARLFKEWMCRPSQTPAVINARLDAIEELNGDLSPEADGIRSLLKKMPDLERQLARHHTLGSLHRSEDHPDSRAILYENDKYNGRKILDFLSALEGLRTATRVKNILKEASQPPKSRLLQRIIQSFPDLSEKLDFFTEAFDPAQAKRDSVIKPRPEVDPQYDEAKEAITTITVELDTYLKEQRRRLGSSDIKYWGNNGKDRYQLEIPESILKKTTPADYEAKSSRKGWRRFHTAEIRRMVDELTEAEEQLAEAQRDEMRRMFAKFDESRDQWGAAVHNLALLDGLLSLAEVSSNANFCRPILSTASEPFIRIRGGRHPCLEARANGDYIPNDVDLGNKTRPQRVMLLSGPNMGGKSTLLRQTCVLAIMAQMGCYVPAEECEWTPVDRIFTRVGASDRILQGQSTFFVELSETANILQNATSRSLVILDELGRGTSTFDGTAIAHAVVSFMVQKLQCRALFATHYHSLVEDWRGHEGVCFGHMACLVEPNGDEQQVTFLYRLADGPSPKSYGLNVARLAHLPKEVIQVAKEKSQTFEAFMDQGAAQQHQGLDPQVALGVEVLALMEGQGQEQIVAAARGLWADWNT